MQLYHHLWHDNPTPNPHLADQAPVFMTLGNRVTQLYPQALGTILVAFYDTHGLQWDHSYPQVT
jgi:hypothetical protein